jgi:hypothetical protein
VVTARGRDHTCGWYRPREQVRKRAAGLEGTRVLQVLQFEAQPEGAEAEIRRIDLDHGRPANERLDQAIRCLDTGAVDGGRDGGHGRALLDPC